jgi:hypothetical protein
MKVFLTLASLFLFSLPSLAAPTHHELGEALMMIADSNNETDGERSFLACFQSGIGFEPSNINDNWQDDRSTYTVTVFVTNKSDSDPFVKKVVYSVIIGPYWTTKAITVLGSEVVEGTASCPADTGITQVK